MSFWSYNHNKKVLILIKSEKTEIIKIIFTNSEQRFSWEKCFNEAKKVFFESSSRKPAAFMSAIPIPRNRSGIQVLNNLIIKLI